MSSTGNAEDGRQPSAISRQQKLLVPALAYFHAALARLALQQVPLPPAAGSE